MSKGNQINHNLYDVLRYPLLTEKTTRLSENNQVSFAVSPSSNKQQIKDAIAQVYGVKALAVNIVNQKGKQKRFKGKLGVRGDLKKAYVTLEKGKTIDIASGI